MPIVTKGNFLPSKQGWVKKENYSVTIDGVTLYGFSSKDQYKKYMIARPVQAYYGKELDKYL